MFIEILLGLVIATILIYLFYLYLEWCSNNSYKRDVYNYTPKLLMPTDRTNMEKYGSYILPTYMADTFKPIRFTILYYYAKSEI
jgi:hypothetical protein